MLCSKRTQNRPWISIKHMIDEMIDVNRLFQMFQKPLFTQFLYSIKSQFSIYESVTIFSHINAACTTTETLLN